MALGVPDIFPAGRFILAALAIDADCSPLARLDPLPAASGFDGLWRWDGSAGTRGYGLLRPYPWSNNDTIDAPGLRNLAIRCPDSQPYGVGVLLGLAYEFTARDCRFSSGAHGVDQARMDVSYVTRLEDCRFFGQRHAAINLDTGLSTLRGLRIQGHRPRYLVRTRANSTTIDDCFFAESGRGLVSAIRLAEATQSTVRRAVFDFETEGHEPAHLIHASLGHNNGGATLVTIDQTPGGKTAGAPVLLDDLWGGAGGRGVSLGRLTLRDSFGVYVEPDVPGLARIAPASIPPGLAAPAPATASPGWKVDASGATATGIPLLAPARPAVRVAPAFSDGQRLGP